MVYEAFYRYSEPVQKILVLIAYALNNSSNNHVQLSIGARYLHFGLYPNGTASANSTKFRGIRPRMYIEDIHVL